MLVRYTELLLKYVCCDGNRMMCYLLLVGRRRVRKRAANLRSSNGWRGLECRRLAWSGMCRFEMERWTVVVCSSIAMLVEILIWCSLCPVVRLSVRSMTAAPRGLMGLTLKNTKRVEVAATQELKKNIRCYTITT